MKDLPQSFVKITRIKKGCYFRMSGKKEGDRGRNFCLTSLFSLGHMRRPKGGGRRSRERHTKFLLSFLEIFFKMSPNFIVQAAPNSKSRFFGRGGPGKLKFHGGFLADDVEVRRAERGIKPNGKMNRIPFGFIVNFLLFAEGKTSKFPLKESDNFPCEARLCPKAITQ